MNLTPDEIILWQYGPIVLNATILYSWFVMLFLFLFSWGITRNLSATVEISTGQNLLEAIVDAIRTQIREITRQDPDPYLPFIGSLFLFISIGNLFSVVPGFRSPFGSLTTTSALAVCVFFAVPVYSISRIGFKNYLKKYVQPSPIMLPFHLIGEVSRTLALAIRLFGNMMSGTVIAGILLSIMPLFVPVIMDLLGLIIGQIQAYIFAVLATVYIASAATVQGETPEAREGSET